MKRVVSRVAAILWLTMVAMLAGCTATKTFRTAHVPDASRRGGGPMRDVLLVGNSVSGTVSIIDGQTYQSLGTVNVIPDLQERLREIDAGFVSRFLYKRIRKAQLVTHFEPADGDRFIDDVFLSSDGATLFVSRSNLGDVAAFDLASPNAPLVWRTIVKGRKADHATISPDGTRIIVSASVVRRAYVLDTTTGNVVASFRTGVLPHQNDYAGKHLYNGSLGRLSLPFARNDDKGARWLTIVDPDTFKVVDKIEFESGVRPTVITEDESTMYMQLSYLNGVAKYDLKARRFVATLDQPLSAFAQKTYRNKDEYPHNSAHHGLAMSKDETMLCDCGTIDNSVSIVSTADMKVVATLEDIGAVPYWATTSADGKHCLVSLSGEDTVAVIDYATQAVVSRVPVGRFPQRNRLGKMPEYVIQGIASRSPRR
jgi:YVTN family beta-propeller protein